MAEVSKGIVALRKHGLKPVTVTINGDKFMFKKLTIGAEDQIKDIIKANQDDTLKPPATPPEGSSDDVMLEHYKEVDEYSTKAAKLFRRLTCDLMKFMLLDEGGAQLFSEDDDIYDLVNNVYAENFFTAYTKFRNGMSGGVAEADSRFQK